MRFYYKRKNLAFTVAIILVLISINFITIINHSLQINSKIEIDSKIYIIALTGSSHNTIVGELSPSGDVKFTNGKIRRNSSYAIIVTDGSNIFWDGKVKTGFFGGAKISVTPETATHRLLSSKFMDLLSAHVSNSQSQAFGRDPQ